MSDPLPAETPRNLALVGRWALANAVGELVGLGGVGLAVQLRVLRGHVARAWRWLLACALGWALGMPLVFLAVRSLAVHGVSRPVVAGSAAALALAGALVGLVEGAFLFRLLPAKLRSSQPSNI